MKNAISIVSMFLVTTSAFAVSKRNMASVKPVNVQVTHARELLGPGYRKTLSRIQNMKNVESQILKTVRDRLPKKYKWRSIEISRAILTEASKHELDPYFVMAVIAGESSFNPQARGPVGEIGLMQIRLKTGEWMSKKMKIDWNGEKSLENPITNIRIGTAYLSHLRKQFANEGQLYLAAYNMGATSVRRALVKNIRPKDYPIHVMKRYIAFYKEI